MIHEHKLRNKVAFSLNIAFYLDAKHISETGGVFHSY